LVHFLPGSFCGTEEFIGISAAVPQTLWQKDFLNMSLRTKKQKHHTDSKTDPEAQPSRHEAAGAEPAAAAEAAEEATATPDQSAAGKPPPAPEAEELAALKDRHARLLADFDNYRKRQLRDREDLVKRANSDLLADLLPVADHLELALANASEPTDPFVTGVRLVYDQFIALLEKYEMLPLDAAGEPFDPAFHEALSQMPSETVPANIVIEQFRRGWLLAGKLLRPAQVIVSSGQPEAPPAVAETAAAQPEA